METNEKPWAVYGEFYKRIGRVEYIDPHSAIIRHSENQQYHPESWDRIFVRTFKKLDDALEYASVEQNELTKEELTIQIRENFPSIFKRKTK